MGTLLTLAAGYIVGLQTDRRELDELTRALRALRQSEEFADVVVAVRSHLGHSLRAMADLVDGGGGLGRRRPRADDEPDLLARVRDLFAAE